MEAILKFNLPEEHLELEAAIAAPNMAGALHDIRAMFRNTLKYDQRPKTAEELEREFFEIISGRGIKLDC
jgi:hypothetical protein